MRVESIEQMRPAGAERRLRDLCGLLERAGAGGFELEFDRGENRWGLRGPDPERIRAVRELLGTLCSAEEDLRSLSSEILQRYEEVTLVYRLTERLGAVLGEEAISELVLADAARVLGASSGALWLWREDRFALTAALPPGRAPQLDDPAALHALRENRVWVTPRDPRCEPAIAVPLPGDSGRPVGVLLLRGRGDGRPFGTVEDKLLTALGGLTAAFVRNGRLAAEARLAEQRQREMEIARQVHRSLLPGNDPQFPGLDISGSCTAAETIGGDLYGYIPLPDGHLGLVLADVSGHGVGAALVMAAAKGAMAAEARRGAAPAELLARANDALAGDLSPADAFVTAFVARFERGGSRFSYAGAGHLPPLLLRTDGRVDALEPSGPALGVIDSASYVERQQQLEPGDRLIAFTDGLVEARDAQRGFFGAARVLDIARRCRTADARGLRLALLDELSRHCGGTPPQDDVTIVVVGAQR
ncbi:MAG TPA: GAF domain-containing SpoIIE family protein phosphatase [Candidatus Polarisedimenticolaceae bacterium]|nr:GAF domain-containing SpoIIE family protein phosphatase [Candidatus Polarisedimenticolaceae bacterium]